MNYLVASSADDLDAKVVKRFGHAAYYLIVDSQTMEFDVIAGVGPDEPAIEVERFKNFKIERVIVGNIGPAAYNGLIKSGWSVYLCRNIPVREAIQKVESGEVSPLKEPTIKQSIHSAQKAGTQRSGRGPGKGRGRGSGTGKGGFNKKRY